MPVCVFARGHGLSLDCDCNIIGGIKKWFCYLWLQLTHCSKVATYSISCAVPEDARSIIEALVETELQPGSSIEQYSNDSLYVIAAGFSTFWMVTTVAIVNLILATRSGNIVVVMIIHSIECKS